MAGVRRTLFYLAYALAFGPLWSFAFGVWMATGVTSTGEDFEWSIASSPFGAVPCALTSGVIALALVRPVARARGAWFLCVPLLACFAGMVVLPVVWMLPVLIRTLAANPREAFEGLVFASFAGIPLGCTALPMAYPLALVELALLRHIVRPCEGAAMTA